LGKGKKGILWEERKGKGFKKKQFEDDSLIEQQPGKSQLPKTRMKESPRGRCLLERKMPKSPLLRWVVDNQGASISPPTKVVPRRGEKN